MAKNNRKNNDLDIVNVQIMEGPEKFHRFVVVEFDSFEQAVGCFQSPEYEEAAAFRRNGAGEVETVMVEGGSI